MVYIDINKLDIGYFGLSLIHVCQTWLDILTTTSQEELAKAITGDNTPKKRPQAVKAVRDALCVRIGTSGDLIERHDEE